MNGRLTRVARIFGALRIRTRFFLIVLCLAVPFFAVIMTSALRQSDIERDAVLKETVAFARSVTLRIDDYVGQMDSLTGTLGLAVTVSQADRHKNDLLLQRARPSFPAFVSNVAVWDLEGNNVGSVDPSARAINVRDRKFFQDALKGDGLAIETPVESRPNGKYLAQFARAVVNDDGEVIGVIAASTQLVRLQNLVDPSGSLPEGGLVTILDLNGTVLARTIDPEKWIGKSVTAAPGFKARSGAREGSGVVSGIDGVERVSAFDTAERAPWRVFVGVRADTIYAPAREHFVLALAIGLALLAFSAASAVLLGRSVSRPVARLVSDANRFGEGELNYRITAQSLPELNRLAAAMNNMASSLEDRDAERRRAEALLAQEKERLKLITDNVPALISYVGTDTRFQFANKTYRDWADRDPEAIIGMSMGELAGKVGLVDPQPFIQPALEGRRVDYEQQFVTKSGVRYLLVTGIPDFDEAGQVRGVFLLGSDISESKLSGEKLAASEFRLKTITDNIPALVCYIDRDRVFRFNNQRYEQWLQVPVAEITGMKVADVYGPDVYATLSTALDEALAGGHVRFEVEFPGRDGVVHFARGTYIPDRDASGNVLGVYGLVLDVTRLKIAENKLWKLAQVDSLTGVANRSQFNQRLEEAVARADQSAAMMAILFLDIDKFKPINDRFGHQTGDQLLVEFARRIKKSVRPTDVVARLGGDEFVVILTTLHNADEAQFVARKILNAMILPFVLGDHAHEVSTSIGIAVRRAGENDLPALLKRADEALYAAKAEGQGMSRTFA